MPHACCCGQRPKNMTSTFQQKTEVPFLGLWRRQKAFWESREWLPCLSVGFRAAREVSNLCFSRRGWQWGGGGGALLLPPARWCPGLLFPCPPLGMPLHLWPNPMLGLGPEVLILWCGSHPPLQQATAASANGWRPYAGNSSPLNLCYYPLPPVSWQWWRFRR